MNNDFSASRPPPTLCLVSARHEIFMELVCFLQTLKTVKLDAFDFLGIVAWGAVCRVEWPRTAE